MKVSVIIPNYNGEKYIENCLDSLLKMTFREYEVIIIDNASRDNSLGIIKQRNEPICLIENATNKGFAGAVNQGIKASTCNYVALLNNDVEVDAAWLETLYKSMLKKKDLFAVSSKMIQFCNRELIDDAGDGYTILGWAYKKGDGQSKNTYNQTETVFSACAGAALYRKSVFDRIGFFDEAFFAYLEDIDISFRARIEGFEIIYSPDSIVYHIGSATSGSKYNDFKIKLASRNNTLVRFKNMPVFFWIINMPFIILGELIKGAFFIKKGYGLVYFEGKAEAFRMMKSMKRTSKGSWLAYIKIEALMIKDTVEYIGYFLKRLKVKANNKRK